MAINFPDSPTDGQAYTDSGTGQTWTYELATNSWTASSLAVTGGVVYKGSVDITAAPPTSPKAGEQWSVSTGGTANAGYGPGVTGTITKGSMVMYTGTDWLGVSHSIPDATATVKGIDKQKWSRTGTVLSPTNAGDKVGIGTTSVAAKLNVATNDLGLTPSVDADELLLESSGHTGMTLLCGTGQRNSIFFGEAPTGSTSGAIIYDASNDSLRFATNGAANERFRVDNTGRLLLGTPTGHGTLQVHDGTFVLSKPGGGSDRNWRLVPSGGAPGDLAIEQSTTSGGTTYDTKLTIDPSGRLLVGTSTAAANYRVGTSSFTPTLQVEGTNVAPLAIQRTDGPPNLFLANGSNVASGGQVGVISFNAKDGTNLVQAATIAAECDGTPGADDMPGRLVFSTTADGASTPTERMRIISNGDIYFGSTTDVSPSVFGATLVHEASEGKQYRSSVNTTVGFNHAAFFNPNGLVGSISTTGSATAYNTSSDYRLKENVTAVTDGITRLQQLKPSRFNFIADPGHTVDGFIAHEAQAVVPECVAGAKDAVDADGKPVYQGIDQSKLVPLLTAALQEAVAKIESLEARLTAAGI